MRRRLLTLFAGLMLLLWLAVLALWIRSHWRGDWIVWQSRSSNGTPTRWYCIDAGDGGNCDPVAKFFRRVRIHFSDDLEK